ncbi:hypothetical protein LCGC14_0891360 [marine sediment metagenome]|uniref:Adhesin domain-containing protein n=1 Tax=marine sediment metagenome TaxID=412755 RepID=A0A0F9PK01_9ZZZZ|nr:MAG: hypothetical protein Lokiarch_31380 [Candidatus Lokiarchaeum sp. GC14_75]HDZ17768.1 hypothetical protein [archaeon]
MLRSKKIVLIIVATLLISGGAIFGIILAVNWGNYAYSNTFYYEPSVHSPIEKISFQSSIGSTIINYNSTATDIYVKVELDISISGPFVAGKLFSNFFKPIIWLNESTPVTTFNLENKPSPWFIFPIVQRMTINVTLRTDIIYDIDVDNSVGSISINIPENIELNNILFSSSTGSITLQSDKNVTFNGNVGLSTSTGSVSAFLRNANLPRSLTATTTTGSVSLNLTNCIIGDDITGTSDTGTINFKSFNLIYTQDCELNLGTSTGSISLQINQHNGMGSEVSGSIGASTGSISVIYRDSLSSVGAEFTCQTTFGSITYTPTGPGGLSKVGSTTSATISTVDYNSANNTYTLSLDTTIGNIGVSGQSL